MLHARARTILITVDNYDVGLLISTIIRRHLDSSTCVLQTSGAATLDTIAHANVDLVIADEWLADMDAYALSRAVKAAHPHLPVLLLTAFLTPQIEAALQHAQIDAFLTKPFHIADLATAATSAIALAA